MSSSPIVLHPFTLPKLLHHILRTQTAATTLIICSSRDVFLQHLLHALEQELSEEQTHIGSGLQDLITPSLHSLSTARHVKLTFCASVQALLAYLTAYGRDGPIARTKNSQQKPRLVLVNPLALHAPTPSFSAQGLSRAFAAATETALRTEAELQVVEYQTKCARTEHDDGEDVDMNEGEESHVAEEDEAQDPWDQEVSILNVSARRFGSNGGERAWAGRTLKARSIAARWFRFQEVGDGEAHEDPG